MTSAAPHILAPAQSTTLVEDGREGFSGADSCDYNVVT